MISALIVEDELNSRELLTQLLLRYCPDVEVVGEAQNAKEGVELIKKLQPELVFLDIEMPGGNGFDLLNAFDPIPFKVIFVTGYDQYAILAIKYAALDYLLKPVSIEELKKAVERVRQSPRPGKSNLQMLEHSRQQEEGRPDKIVLSDQKTYVLIPLEKIIYLEAMGNYVAFHLLDQPKKVVSHPLSYYEEILPQNLFFRIHKSYMVNLAMVKEFSGGRGGEATLKNDIKLPIAFRRKPGFVKKIQNIHGA